MFIMITIGLSSIALAAEDPVDEKSPINAKLDELDHIFTAIFAVEMILKIIDLGTHYDAPILGPYLLIKFHDI